MKTLNAAILAAAIAVTPLAALAATPPAGSSQQTTTAAGQAAAGVTRVAMIALSCTAGSGDVARPLWVKNTSSGAIASGKVVNWALGSAHGKQQLSSALAVGATVTINGPAGSGGVCTASVAK